MIKERTRISLRIYGPSNCMLNIARLEMLVSFLNLPNLLQTNTIELRVAVFTKVEFLYDFL